MDTLQQTSSHNRLSIGHAFVFSGLLLFLIFSVLISTVAPLSAEAFGVGLINNLSNGARTVNGLAPYGLNEQLITAAQNKANAMAAGGYFEHTSPDGTTGWDYINSANYSYTYAGENLAASNEDDQAVVNGWLNSPSHRANLLSSIYAEVGYGIAYAGDYQDYQNVYFVVALYAKPANNQIVINPPVQSTTETVTPTTNQAAPPSSSDAQIETSPIASEITPSVTSDISNTEEKTNEGVSSLSKRRNAISSQLSFGLLSVGTTLSIGGISIEAKRLLRHKKHWLNESEQ